MHETSVQRIESSQSPSSFHPTSLPDILDFKSVNAPKEHAPVRVATQEMYSPANLPNLTAAQSIADLFREAYGDKYPDVRFLDPLQIRDVIKKGEYLFAALLDESGQVLGIGGISHFEYLGANVEHYGRVCEFGKLIVAERARGARLTGDLTIMRVEYVQQQGYSSVVSLPFASHDRSQRSLSKVGFERGGISICDWDDVFGVGQRESAIFMHLILDQEIRKPRQVFLPPELHHVAEIAYASLKCERSFAVEAVADATGSEPEIRTDEVSGAHQIFLHCPTRVDDMFYSIGNSEANNIRHIAVSMDVGNALVLPAIRRLLAEGFRFSGLHPFAKTDIITLQKVLDLPESPITKLKIFDDESGSLLRIINKILE